MMEPLVKLLNLLIKKMSSDEEKYFNIPTNRTVEELRNIIEKKYPDILSIILKRKKTLKNFGLFQKTKKNQD